MFDVAKRIFLKRLRRKLETRESLRPLCELCGVLTYSWCVFCFTLTTRRYDKHQNSKVCAVLLEVFFLLNVDCEQTFPLYTNISPLLVFEGIYQTRYVCFCMFNAFPSISKMALIQCSFFFFFFPQKKILIIACLTVTLVILIIILSLWLAN